MKVIDTIFTDIIIINYKNEDKIKIFNKNHEILLKSKYNTHEIIDNYICIFSTDKIIVYDMFNKIIRYDGIKQDDYFIKLCYLDNTYYFCNNCIFNHEFYSMHFVNIAHFNIKHLNNHLYINNINNYVYVINLITNKIIFLDEQQCTNFYWSNDSLITFCHEGKIYINEIDETNDIIFYDQQTSELDNYETIECLCLINIDKTKLKYIQSKFNLMKNIKRLVIKLNYFDFYNKKLKLDLSKLTSLEHLDCHTNTLLSLDLSKLVNLKRLICSENLLMNLNLNNLINLEYLDCSFNQLSFLNMSHLINLKYLICQCNQLTSIDLSKLVNLKYIDCSDNIMTSLNFCNNGEIKFIKCCENKLSALDLKYLHKLKFLDCNKNQLSTLELFNVNLRYMDCKDNKLNDLNLLNVLNLKYINYDLNKITSDVNHLTKLTKVNDKKIE